MEKRIITFNDNLYDELTEYQEIFIDDCFLITENIYKEQDKEVKKVIKQQKEDEKFILDHIGRLLVYYTVIDGFLNLTHSEKVNLKNTTNNIIKDIIKEQYKQEKKTVESVMKETAKQKFYSYEYFTGKKNKYEPIDIYQKINNKTFADRIYDNKNLIQKKLINETNSIIDGKTGINDIVTNISNISNINLNKSNVLDKNQIAIAHQEANNQLLEKENIELILWIATLDLKTCNDCASLDNKVFEKSKAPSAPRHVGCRCCTTPIIDRNWRPSTRMDNINKKNIDFTDYKQWYEDNYRK